MAHDFMAIHHLSLLLPLCALPALRSDLTGRPSRPGHPRCHGDAMQPVARSFFSKFADIDGLSGWRTAGIAFVFVWFFFGGIAHFALTATEMRIVPPYITWPRAAVLISGVFELLGAAGLIWGRTRRAAGIGLFLLTLAVTPVHFFMLQRPELFGVPYWALVLRLPVQVALLALIAWCTRQPKGCAAVNH